MAEAHDAAEILNQALPYIQRFQGQTFVVKYGGNAMSSPEAVRGVIRNVLLLQLVGIRPVLVHGGGPEIESLLARLGIETRTVEGLRVTDDATMEAVEMALAGKANKAVVAEVQACGGKAVGISGRDGGTIIAEPVSKELGRVGRIVKVDPTLINIACENGYVPVVCSVASAGDHTALNVNADSAAAAVAVAVRAQKLLVLSDTDGVLSDKEDPASLISRLSVSQANQMVESGKADKGMVPKLRSA
ncbi:MAG TPA: acetylglutamate kinase, partial [Fimbriimonadaceae bacterium]|nr:acetylglutamate kinase [Fimbriimonadaceae bacterium]